MAARRLLGSVTAVGLGAALLTLGAPAVAQPAPGLADGSWVGSLFYSASVLHEGEIPGEYLGSGAFSAEAFAGSLEGAFVFEQTTVVRPPDVEPAIAHSSIAGDLEGSAVRPELAFDLISVASTSSGITIDLTFTAAELGNPRIGLVPLSAGCGFVSGFWNSEFGEALTAQGQFIEGRQGTWTAHQTASTPASPAETLATMASLEAEVDGLIRGLRDDGIWTADVVGDVLARAEGLAVGGVPRRACDPEVDDTAFRSRGFSAVQQLLEEAALSDAVLPGVVVELVLAGHRAGVFAADPELEAFYNATLDEIWSGMLDRDATREDLLAGYTAAVQLGRSDVAAELATALETVDR